MNKVLICDDEEGIREYLKELIEEEFAVTFIDCKNGDEAIRAIKNENSIDLIICDLQMPGLGGEDVFKYNIEHDRYPFFLLSGHDLSFDGSIPEFNKENDCVIITKPWDDDHLIKECEIYLTKN